MSGGGCFIFVMSRYLEYAPVIGIQGQYISNSSHNIFSYMYPKIAWIYVLLRSPKVVRVAQREKKSNKV